MSYQIPIAVLTFLSVIGLGGAVVAAQYGQRRAMQMRMRSDSLDLPDPRDMEADPGWMELLSRIGRVLSGNQPTRNLEQELARAGYHGVSAAPIFVGVKVLLLGIGVVVTSALLWPLEISTGVRGLLVAMGAATLFFIPNVVVRMQRERRRKEIRLFLPNAIDLLEICVASGMGLQMAWNCVADEIREVSPTLADEMALMNLETHLGATTAAAMRHMSERSGIQEIATLTAVIVQSERFGTSIGDALRVFADSLRETRSQRAQEAAEKMTVKLIFPMVLFIFPAAMIVMAGPAFLQLFEALGD